MRTILILTFLLTAGNLRAEALQEVNAWRKAYGLSTLVEVPWMTKFAQRKAEYRAARGLKNGHAGPRCPAGCREGTAEATPWWGWLSCCMEETGHYAGAGVAVGDDGDRYMVLLLWGTDGAAPIGRKITPLTGARSTAKLTPNPVRVERR